MSKFTTLLILALLLCSTLSCTARREPLPLEGTLVKTQQRVGLKHGDEAREHGEVGDESCVGVGEEECLMRRTLAAHVDYIYTQKQNP
ncbi:phytosulfokines 3 isoform X1 [Rhododendron vialii]|uniref:phytosulfokines 3 isoform X1 n=1 Tax=Rhododendron vialii TaxID=182163 RepID=UPI00265FF211|nr:phytosulfokines 3 isoform X1 [Rhododendron vialii]